MQIKAVTVIKSLCKNFGFILGSAIDRFRRRQLGDICLVVGAGYRKSLLALTY